MVSTEAGLQTKDDVRREVAEGFGGGAWTRTTLFFEFLPPVLLYSCFIWVLYLALEPFVRRRWLATLVSGSQCWQEAFGIHWWDATCAGGISTKKSPILRQRT
jgi:hypothetical protein